MVVTIYGRGRASEWKWQKGETDPTPRGSCNPRGAGLQKANVQGSRSDWWQGHGIVTQPQSFVWYGTGSDMWRVARHCFLFSFGRSVRYRYGDDVHSPRGDSGRIARYHSYITRISHKALISQQYSTVRPYLHRSYLLVAPDRFKDLKNPTTDMRGTRSVQYKVVGQGRYWPGVVYLCFI